MPDGRAANQPPALTTLSPPIAAPLPGASFLRRDSSPWSTDKDGLIPCLLAAEMTARDGRDPGERYRGLVERFGGFDYKRTDVEATPE